MQQTIKNNILSVCTEHIETCVVDVVYKKIKVSIVAVYRPPQGSKLEFIQELDRISNIASNNSHSYFLGYINLNLLDLGNCQIHDSTFMLYSKYMA